MVSVNVFHWTHPGYSESLGSNPTTLMSQLLLVQIQIVVLLNPGTNPLDLTALTKNLVTPSHPGSTRWVRACASWPHSNPSSADSEPRTGGCRRTLKSKSRLRNLDCRYRNCRLKASKPDLDKPCMSNSAWTVQTSLYKTRYFQQMAVHSNRFCESWYTRIFLHPWGQLKSCW